jgi:DNA-binding response OmpR family regulator
MKPSVLSIGQCAPDSVLLERFFSELGAECVSVADEVQARKKLEERPWKLIIANRVFDSDGSSGIHVLAMFAKMTLAQDPVYMLVSNYQDAQDEALACGLTKGFGKAELRTQELRERVKSILSMA